ncbi:hypothetical protein BC832DRAFT_592755 [Gaertneriomyces semiglobifer]|nr:hypothetical protein BC832DRAFT_592755 [Gaertneriomyces semiglobifer]
MDSLRIAFIHPDLGIGGAERLVVDAAVGLQNLGHAIDIYTSHHDRSHCFEETRDGTLNVIVAGDWLPRHIAGKGHIVFAILRNLLVCLGLLLTKRGQYDVLFVDQLSVGVPLLRLTGAKVLFYCHFPDKLLTQRKSFLKKLYRLPIDYIEELTTNMSDEVVVNSEFTASIFAQSFKTIRRKPQVVYPGIQLETYDAEVNLNDPSVAPLVNGRKMLLSINRFERKKNVELAVETFARLKPLIPETFPQLLLVVAGGYDIRVQENVEHLKELQRRATSLGLVHDTFDPEGPFTVSPAVQVLFLPSFTSAQRTYLLSHSVALLYTPSHEHFGIVPVEAMYARLPVIATNTGGPTETVLDGVTGFLRNPQPDEFAGAVQQLLSGKVDVRVMGAKGRERVKDMFSDKAFISNLDVLLKRLAAESRPNLDLLVNIIIYVTPLLAVFLGIYWLSGPY